MTGGSDAAGAAAAATAGSEAAGTAKSIELRLASKLSVQLVRSSAAAGSKAPIESVSEVRIGWMIGSIRASKSAFAGAAVTVEPVAIAAAAKNTPALAPMPTSSRRPALALRACFLPS